MKKNFSRGFTLIEVIIYLALFSILIGGAFATTFVVFESNLRNKTKVIVQEEGRFLAGKVDWALSSIKSVDAPLAGDSGSILSVVKYDDEAIDIRPVGLVNMEIERGTNPPKTLNNSNVEVSSLVFTHTYVGGAENPEKIEAKFTVSARTPAGVVFSQDFYTVKYIRR